jgi:hypothetical protein
MVLRLAAGEGGCLDPGWYSCNHLWLTSPSPHFFPLVLSESGFLKALQSPIHGHRQEAERMCKVVFPHLDFCCTQTAVLFHCCLKRVDGFCWILGLVLSRMVAVQSLSFKDVPCHGL